MRSRLFAPTVVAVGLTAGTLLFAAQDQKSVGFTAQEPVLLTSAGQSADSQIVKVLLERNKVGLKSLPLAGPGDLAGAKTLVVVIGGSSKGLGAAGIDADKELARVQKILGQAKAAGIPVLAMHVGGIAKRGELSDRFVSLVVPASSFLVAVKEGDQDGLLTKLAEKAKIRSLFVERLSQLQQPLKTIFGK